VGSDTIQDVMNGMAKTITIGGVQVIGSYDAVTPVTAAVHELISTRDSGAASTQFTRPNGSGEGVKALSYSTFGSSNVLISGGTTIPSGSVDFARSSSGPSGSYTGTDRDLAFIPFAQDAVTYAVSAASAFPRNLPLGPSYSDAPTNSVIDTAALNLYNIYHCTVSTYSASGKNYLIHPLLPQSGSGTRKYWVQKVGLADSTGTELSTLPSCVKDSYPSSSAAQGGGASVQEHDGTGLVDPGDIAPFSISQYLAQGNHKALPSSVDERRGNIALGSIGGFAPITFTPGINTTLTSGQTVVSTASTPAANTLFPVKRFVFNVVPTATINSTAAVLANPDLNSVFVSHPAYTGDPNTTATTALICQHPEVISEYGFITIGSLCGTVNGTQTKNS
jgi:hypothetical protein